jgi:hypothetical protein
MEKTANFGTADTFLNKLKKKRFSLFYIGCLSINAEFHGQFIYVHYLWVLMLSLSIINQILFQ